MAAPIVKSSNFINKDDDCTGIFSQISSFFQIENEEIQLPAAFGLY